MNVKVLLTFLALAVVAIIALNWILAVGLARSPTCPVVVLNDKIHQEIEQQRNTLPWLFGDLSPEEMTSVLEYLKSHLEVKLVSCNKALPSDNFIYLIELQVPPKGEVLRFLNGQGSKPPRKARAVVVFGGQAEPNVTEYIVGNLLKPTYHKDVTSQKYQGVNFNSRPLPTSEYVEIFFKMGLGKVAQVLKESFGVDAKGLLPLDSAPRGFKSGDRETWFPFLRNIGGLFMHPVPFEVLMDHSSKNSSDWKVKKVYYNGQYFDSLEHLADDYSNGRVKKIMLHRKQDEPNYASLKPRGETRKVLPPMQYEPEGIRYHYEENWVNYLGWNFAFRQNVESGLQLFNIEFQGKRIVYELSIQDLTSVYGGITPSIMRTKFLDTAYGIGRLTNELVMGVDCPYVATYIDTHHFLDSEEPQTVRNSICVFEQNFGKPLRRHTSSWFPPLSYGGLSNSALVLRSISTIGNYDYVFDFIFYQNGVLETKVQATGYAQTTFYSKDGLKYGTRIEENILGNIHTHFLHFKVDLDVEGTQNCFETKDVVYEKQKNPLNPDVEEFMPTINRQVLETEDQAAFKVGQKTPKYLSFINLNSNNEWGHPRGYRIRVVSYTPDNLPPEDPQEKGISWHRYQLAVTQHKEGERTSSSMFNQNDPWNPAVYFAGFINNETIKNQDLVAWVTAGFLHIPHSEDVPNTATVGSEVGFLLQPVNYFKQDPSIFSMDSVYIESASKEQEDHCKTNPMACLPKMASCVQPFPLFTYGQTED
ncbi:retina-specific copper amine oxidase [Callorhinchus milii]|uniref:retina-specific copper amine oxidase n=1 Tax=Callorhinchus milii TaxID=7868 RepID=UPI00045750D5|nr:retina-specific copper amine oxidase [Callorhinchus milii]XP_042199298.1 retina-specific copper amine oxidase [Callorhinchus milii]|eukprot:gi/632989367/ref/XP_007883613.1/ PREDICTED: retina-specific copper amine oxidase-like [Callorhinchus milii]